MTDRRRPELSDDERGLGYDVLLWVKEAVALCGFVLLRISVDLANASAAEKMHTDIEAIRRIASDASGDAER